MSVLRERQIEMVSLAARSELALGASANLTVVAASPEGSALLVTWQKFRVLFPGGIPPERLPLDELSGPALLILAERDLAETSLEEKKRPPGVGIAGRSGRSSFGATGAGCGRGSGC